MIFHGLWESLTSLFWALLSLIHSLRHLPSAIHQEASGQWPSDKQWPWINVGHCIPTRAGQDIHTV